MILRLNESLSKINTRFGCNVTLLRILSEDKKLICSGSGNIHAICIRKNIDFPFWIHKSKALTDTEEYDRIRKANAIITPVVKKIKNYLKCYII